MNLIIKKIIKKIIYYDKLKQEKKKIDDFFNRKRSISGYNRYTVISAVYNVDKYLEEYFESIVNQTLKFEEHIHLVMVDDGSPDDSADIIKKWQEKYPNNITYIKKENGGQASARNLGMEYVKTEWVTFIDPDDFLDYRYFEEVDSFLERNKDNNIGLISCNFIFYYEDKESIGDSHALKYRFKENEKIVTPSNMEGLIQLSVNSVFFKNSLLKEKDIKFFENIRPNFEDGHFVNRYFIENSEIDIAFLKKAKYLYRKRSDGTSTLDTSWKSIGKFTDVLENGYLDILKTSHSKFAKAPLYIQRTVLYDLMWHFKLFLNNSHKLSHLNSEQKANYLTKIEEIFHYIDKDTIEDFNLAGTLYMHKVGLLGCYKKSKPSIQRCYIDEYDDINKEVKVHFFYHDPIQEVFYIDGQVIESRITKIRKYDFIDKIFVYEKIIWLPLHKSAKKLKILLDNEETLISINEKIYKNELQISKLLQHISHKYKLFFKHIPYKKYNGAWLFMDRDIQADDNAEHLYRYIKTHNSNLPIFFILSKDSHDWERLEKDGFSLIKFGTFSHIVALLKANHLISSHADRYVTDFIPRRFFKSFLKYKFTFLQHGVIKHDLSNWLNSKDIHCFVTTSPKEYHSISGDYNRYKFTKKEVVLTGLPRHDTLLLGADKKEKTILVMPTWREQFVGKTIGRGHKRSLNKNFEKTVYAKHWKSFLHSKRLQKLSNTYGYKIIFFPHTNIQPYLDIFDIPDHIETLTHSVNSIQLLFQRASILITDYSSVAFEMGILERESIYYQFDKNEVFGGAHTFQKGYFDDTTDGFGPVCEKENEVLDELENFLEANGNMAPKYLKRIEEFFAYHDTNNCQRVVAAIKNLEKSFPEESEQC